MKGEPLTYILRLGLGLRQLQKGQICAGMDNNRLNLPATATIGEVRRKCFDRIAVLIQDNMGGGENVRGGHDKEARSEESVFKIKKVADSSQWVR